MFNYKPYRYTKGENSAVDADFASVVSYEKVRPGKSFIFWKSGLRWHHIPVDNIQRIFRRVEAVHGKLCCGGRSFFIEWLVLVRSDGSELVLHIGDDVQKKAEALLQYLKEHHPQIQYGKV